MLLLDQEGYGGEGVDSIRKIVIISEKMALIVILLNFFVLADLKILM
ncbi:Flp pilus assembly protein, ATPase [Actinobacillus equuli]|nr:Flp pilus assembly protein, ATPase [Actinobacillus equuli]